MPTNRKRKLRRSNWIPAVFIDEYKTHLRAADFLGDLMPEEIEVAKKLNIYCWDATVKEWNTHGGRLRNLAGYRLKGILPV
jgi:hypothetical protein